MLTSFSLFCSIICPEVEGNSMSLWTIMSKVRIEAFMWVCAFSLALADDFLNSCNCNFWNIIPRGVQLLIHFKYLGFVGGCVS